jgi:hypothetical protein
VRLVTFSFVAFVLAAGATPGCSCTGSAACALRGPLNDPSNHSLRRSLMAGGLKEFCRQMTTHNAPLKMTNDAPAIGRFYATQCQQSDAENGDLYVRFSGFGYAWTNISKKLTFTMSGAVQYNQDFLIADDCSVYGYFRPRNNLSSDFRIHVVENPVTSFLNALSPIAENFGRQLVQGKLAEGFTVITDADMQNPDVGLGIIEKGQRPVHPFNVHGSGRATYENARSEVHQNQRDFIGPIEVEVDGNGRRAIFVTAQMDGAPVIDVLLMRKMEAEQSLQLYFDYPQAGPLAAAPPPMPSPMPSVVTSDVLQAGQPFARTIPVPPGMYYVVLDNTPSAGQVAPPMNPFDDRAAVVSYVIQIGDAP